MDPLHALLKSVIKATGHLTRKKIENCVRCRKTLSEKEQSEGSLCTSCRFKSGLIGLFNIFYFIFAYMLLPLLLTDKLFGPRLGDNALPFVIMFWFVWLSVTVGFKRFLFWLFNISDS